MLTSAQVVDTASDDAQTSESFDKSNTQTNMAKNSKTMPMTRHLEEDGEADASPEQPPFAGHGRTSRHYTYTHSPPAAATTHLAAATSKRHGGFHLSSCHAKTLDRSRESVCICKLQAQ